MSVAKSPEFRRRAPELAAQGEPVAQVAKNLGISESGPRRWQSQDRIDTGQAEGLTSDERRELIELRRKNRVLETEFEILKRASTHFTRENILPKVGFRCIHELADQGIPVAVACRVLKVSHSGHYEWRDRPLSQRVLSNRELLLTIRQAHQQSRGTHGAPRGYMPSCSWAGHSLQPQARRPADARRRVAGRVSSPQTGPQAVACDPR